MDAEDAQEFDGMSNIRQKILVCNTVVEMQFSNCVVGNGSGITVVTQLNTTHWFRPGVHQIAAV